MTIQEIEKRIAILQKAIDEFEAENDTDMHNYYCGKAAAYGEILADAKEGAIATPSPKNQGNL